MIWYNCNFIIKQLQFTEGSSSSVTVLSPVQQHDVHDDIYDCVSSVLHLALNIAVHTMALYTLEITTEDAPAKNSIIPPVPTPIIPHVLSVDHSNLE